MIQHTLCSLALSSVLACLRPHSVAAQAGRPTNPALWGTWKATDFSIVNRDTINTTTIVLVFQPNGRGYTAWSPGYAKTPFSYSFLTPDRIVFSGGQYKPHRYSITFVTPDKVSFATYPEQELREEISLFEFVTFERQDRAGTTR